MASGLPQRLVSKVPFHSPFRSSVAGFGVRVRVGVGGAGETLLRRLGSRWESRHSVRSLSPRAARVKAVPGRTGTPSIGPLSSRGVSRSLPRQLQLDRVLLVVRGVQGPEGVRLYGDPRDRRAFQRPLKGSPVCHVGVTPV